MAKIGAQGSVNKSFGNATAAIFGAILLIVGLYLGSTLSIPPEVTMLPVLSEDTIQLVNPRRRASSGNESCVVVGCYTPDTPGVESYWDYYSKSEYASALYAMEMVTHKGRRSSDKWCDVAAARDELRIRPNSKVIYVDIDTKIDVRAWCNLPNHEAGPIIINSLTRPPAKGPTTDLFTVEGTQLQSNVFRAAPGTNGLLALKRWEENFYSGPLSDQGALHRYEKGICGVPGWLACYNNPEQQTCHCFGSGNKPGKINCIAKLFNGTYHKCKMNV